MRFPLALFAFVLFCPAARAQNETAPGLPATVTAPEIPKGARPADVQGQIEFDLKQFIKELNQPQYRPGDPYSGVSSYLTNSRIGFFGASEWVTFFLNQKYKSVLRFDSVEIEAQDGDTARVKVTLSQLSPDMVADAQGNPREETRTDTHSETLELRRERGDFHDAAWNHYADQWHIVPPSYQEAAQARPLTLQNVAYFAGQRPDTLTQLRRMISSYNLKASALAVIMLAQDYDGRFRFTNDFWPEAARPYSTSENNFLIPGTKTPFTFNDNLSDRKLGDVTKPAETVLFYEGTNKKPVFRYNDKAAIGFADGHVKLVSEEEAEDLLWNS